MLGAMRNDDLIFKKRFREARMKSWKKPVVYISIMCIAQSLIAQDSESFKDGKILLSKWEMISTVLEKASGEEISTGHCTTTAWYPVEVPTTVLNGLVKNGVYPNPRLDMNNYLIPDISDEFNTKHDLAKYSYLPNHVNPWKDPYWFRTKFKIPENYRGRQVWLNFDGINYRGEVWLNGRRIADSSEMVGMFRRFKYNVTEVMNGSDLNYLAVKIYSVDHPGIPGTQMKVFGPNRGPAEDLFKDVTLKISGGWDCALPVRDRNMGIYQPVYLTFTNNVDIVEPYVVTSLPLPDTSEANLTIRATLVNVTDHQQSGLLKGKIDLLTDVDMGDYVKHYHGNMESITFEKQVIVPAKAAAEVTVSYRDFPQLTIRNPHLWWPNGYGEQYLHNLELSFEYDGKLSAVKNIMFGIREVSSTLHKLNDHYGRVFYVNGQRIFCRGGWIQPDMLLDNNRGNIYDQVRLIANANLNIVSSEDMPAPLNELVEALDKYGLMWWEVFYQCWVTVPGTKSAHYPLDHSLAKESTRDIILRYRNSPSLVAWCAANESLPDSDLYFALKDQLRELDTTRVFLPSTAIWWDWEKLSPYIRDDLPVGTTDVGPPGYTWRPLPFYFEIINEVKDQMFRNELGVPAVPTLSSLRKFIFNLGGDRGNPYFPLDSVWAEHGAWDGNRYAFRAYDDAIRNYYGFKTKSVADYARIAQIVNADSYRAMFEAANSRMWDITSGVMLWKLNSSYPDVLWQLYDWYLNPNAGYYYTRKACEPLHIQMNANDYKVSVVNTLHKPVHNVIVRARLYDLNLKLKWKREIKIDMGADRYLEVFRVPRLSRITPIYFVRLELVSGEGEILSRNFYWESSKGPPDFSKLSRFGNVKLGLRYTTKERNGEYLVYVTVKNPTKKLSIMNRLAIVKKNDNQEVLPTFWSDNFITLFPGEGRTLEARFAKEDLRGSAFTVVVDNNM